MKKLFIGTLMFVSGMLGAAEIDDPVAQVERYESDAAFAQALHRAGDKDCLSDDAIADALREEDEDKGDGDDFDRAIELSQELFKGSCAETECTVKKSLFQRPATGKETLAELFARRGGKAGFIQTDFDYIIAVLLKIISSAEDTIKCFCGDDSLYNALHKIGITTCCNQCICSSCSKREQVQQKCPYCRTEGKNYGIFRYDANQHKLFLTIHPRRSCCVVQ